MKLENKFLEKEKLESEFLEIDYFMRISKLL